MIRRLALAVSLAAASAAAEDLFPFLPSYDKAEGVADMSHLVDAPAGAHGRIRVEGIS